MRIDRKFIEHAQQVNLLAYLTKQFFFLSSKYKSHGGGEFSETENREESTLSMPKKNIVYVALMKVLKVIHPHPVVVV